MAKSITPRRCTLITPHDTNPAVYDALRVYSAAGCTVRVVPLNAGADTDTVDLSFGAGAFTEPLAVRLVKSTGLSGSPVVHGYKN